MSEQKQILKIRTIRDEWLKPFTNGPYRITVYLMEKNVKTTLVYWGDPPPKLQKDRVYEVEISKYNADWGQYTVKKTDKGGPDHFEMIKKISSAADNPKNVEKTSFAIDDIVPPKQQSDVPVGNNDDDFTEVKSEQCAQLKFESVDEIYDLIEKTKQSGEEPTELIEAANELGEIIENKNETDEEIEVSNEEIENLISSNELGTNTNKSTLGTNIGQSKFDLDLTPENIKRFICPLASDQEVAMFLALCINQGLNPFIKDAYLIKYSPAQPASMVVAKTAFMKRAEQQPDFQGFEAGVIIDRNGEIIHQSGAFKLKGDEILGGWAKVFRKDHQPYFIAIGYHEYVQQTKNGQPNRFWKDKPGTMIRKVALVQALREAFPSALQGMYDATELGLAVEDVET
jgi:phage recombination protein Bet